GCTDTVEHQPVEAPNQPPAIVETPELAPPAPPPEVKPRVFAASREDCEKVPVYVAGTRAGEICKEDAATEGLTVIDLSDKWTPGVFAESADGEAPEYRAKYLELAASPTAELGLHGIPPNMTI